MQIKGKYLPIFKDIFISTETGGRATENRPRRGFSAELTCKEKKQAIIHLCSFILENCEIFFHYFCRNDGSIQINIVVKMPGLPNADEQKQKWRNLSPCGRETVISENL
jgi:hypothetical protein